MRGDGVVILGVEKKAVAKLQEDRTVRKIALLDDHVAMAFAGTYVPHCSVERLKLNLSQCDSLRSLIHFVWFPECRRFLLSSQV